MLTAPFCKWFWSGFWETSSQRVSGVIEICDISKVFCPNDTKQKTQCFCNGLYAYMYNMCVFVSVMGSCGWRYSC